MHPEMDGFGLQNFILFYVTPIKLKVAACCFAFSCDSDPFGDQAGSETQ